MLTVIVLAAGTSSRMGAVNKLLLPFLDSTILEVTLGRILASEAVDLVVVLGHEAARIGPLLEKFPVRTVFNPDYAAGMTTSIQAGVRVASEDTEGFMICLSDMPLIETATYRSLIQAFYEKVKADKNAIIQPVFENTPGNPVVFSAAYKNSILALDFKEGCKPLVQNNRQHVYPVEVPTDAIFRDADTEAAYKALLFG